MEKPEVAGKILYEMASAVQVARRRLIQLNEEDYDIYELQIKLNSLRMCGNDIARNARTLLAQHPEV